MSLSMAASSPIINRKHLLETAICRLGEPAPQCLSQFLLSPKDGRPLKSYSTDSLEPSDPLFSELNRLIATLEKGDPSRKAHRSYIQAVCKTADRKNRWRLLKGDALLTTGPVSRMVPQKLVKTILLSTTLPGLHFKRSSSSIEQAARELTAHLANEEGPLFVKLENIVSIGKQRVSQLFEVILPGERLFSLLNPDNPNHILKQLPEKVSSSSFSAGFLYDLLFLPGNGKAEQFQLNDQGEIEAIGSINELSDQCRSIRFLLNPLMERPFDPLFRKRLIEFDISASVINWALSLQNPLPIFSFAHIHTTLTQIKSKLIETNLTHWELLYQVDPLLYEFYRNLTNKYPDRPLEAELEFKASSPFEEIPPLPWSPDSLFKAALLQNHLPFAKALFSQKKGILLQRAWSAVIKEGSSEAALFLTELDDLPEGLRFEEETLFHLAAKANRADLILILLRLDQQGVNGSDPMKRTPLHIGALYGNVGATRELLKAGADPFSVGENGESPLHLAIYSRSGVELIRLILDYTPRDRQSELLHLRDLHGNIPLHLALAQGDHRLAKFLIQNGSNVNTKDRDGYTPLQQAVRKKEEVTIRLLLKVGARVDLLEDSPKNPLDIALESGADGAARLLIASLVTEPHFCEQLLAAEKRILSFLKKGEYRLAAEEIGSAFTIPAIVYHSRLELRLNQIERDLAPQKSSSHPFLIRSYRTQFAQTQLSGQQYKKNLTALFETSLNSMGLTPTKYALIALDGLSREELCSRSKLKIAILIEKRSALPFFQSVAQLFEVKIAALAPFPLEIVAIDEPYQVARHLAIPQHISLLKGEKKIETQCKKALAQLPYKTAALSNLRGSLKKWQKNRTRFHPNRDLLNPVDLYIPFETALQSILLYFGNGQLTIRQGVDRLPFNGQSRKALLDVFNTLTFSKVENPGGIYHFLLDFFRLILNFVNDPRSSILKSANLIYHQEEPSIYRLIKHRKIDTSQAPYNRSDLSIEVDGEGRSLLHVATVYGQVDNARLLLPSFGERIPLTPYRETPLHLAASIGNSEMVALLLSHYPPEKILPTRDRNGETALHRAARGGDPETIRLLLQNGARLDLLNTYEQTPFDISLRREEDATAHLLLFGIVQPSTSSSSSSYDNTVGGSLSALLEKGDLNEQIFFLVKQASLSLKRPDFWEATLLLNSAYSLASKKENYSLCKKILVNQMEQIEKRFIQKKIQSVGKYQGRTKDHRSRLKQIRKKSFFSFEQKRPIDQVLKELTQKYKSILSDLLNESIEIMGRRPPTPFAMVGLGSMSRDEACPYSDIEFLFLIKEEGEENYHYFRSLARLIALKIANLGETEFKLIRTQSEDGIITEKSPTQSGFSLDGGLSPLGAKGLYNEGLHELIGTPDHFAQFQLKSCIDGAEVILVNALRTVCWIAGDKKLVNLYKQKIKSILNSSGCSSSSDSSPLKVREQRALELIQGFADEFEPKLDQSKIDLRGFNVKKELYRLPQTMTSGLALYYGIKSNNTLDQISELEQKGVISPLGKIQLEKTVLLILYLRAQAHFFYKTETEVLYYPHEGDNEEAQTLLVITPEISQKITEIYRTLIPLHRTALDFVNGNRSAFVYASFYDSSVGTYDPKLKDNLKFDAALQSATICTALDPSSLSHHNLATVQYDLGLAVQSAQHFERVLSLLIKERGEDPDPDIAATLNNLGNAYSQSGNFSQAIHHLNAALTMLRQLSSNQAHPTIAMSLENLGALYGALGDYRKAIEYLTASLETYNLFYKGQPHRDTAGVLNNLGSTYNQLGDSSQSVYYHRAALKMQKKMHGGKLHPDIASSLNNLGTTYYKLNDYSQAIKYYTDSLEMKRKIYGDRLHLTIAGTLTNLGNCYFAVKEYRVAIEHHKESLEINKKIDDRPHPNIAMVLYNLGICYFELDDSPEAIDHFHAALSIYRQAYNNQPHQSIASSLAKLGFSYLKIGDDQTGVEYIREAYAMHIQTYGADHHSTATLKEILELIYHDKVSKSSSTQSVEDCQRLLLELKDIYGERPHLDVAKALSNLGYAYSRLKKHLQAIEHYDAALKMYRQTHSNQHKDIARTLFNLGCTYGYLNNYPQEIEHYDAALKMYRQAHNNQPHLHIAISLTRLGDVYSRLGEYLRAIAFYQESLIIRKQIHDNQPHEEIAEVLSDLGNSYSRLENYPQAIEHYDAALKMHREIHNNQPHQEIAKTLNDLGDTYRRLEDYPKAIKHFNSALKMFRLLYGDKPDHSISQILDNIGFIYLTSGQYRLALEHYQAALSMKKQIYGDQPHLEIASNLRNIGHLSSYFTSGYSQAMESLQNAYAMFMELVGPEDEQTKFTRSILEHLSSGEQLFSGVSKP